MHPTDVPTIREILEDHGIDDFLNSAQYATLLAELQQRENIMITEIVPHFIVKDGLDKIIKQY